MVFKSNFNRKKVGIFKSIVLPLFIGFEKFIIEYFKFWLSTFNGGNIHVVNLVIWFGL